jgi:hypothetical protein
MSVIGTALMRWMVLSVIDILGGSGRP